MQPLQHWDNIHRDFRESRLATARQQANCEWDNCHLSLRALAINRSLVALRRPRPAYQTPYPPPAVLRAPPSAMSIVRRRRRGPVIAGSSRRSPLPPPPAIQLRSRGQNRESRSRPKNCDSRPGNAIYRKLKSLFWTTATLYSLGQPRAT